MEPGTPWAEFEAEVLRINRRYNEEVIEGQQVCPYARPSREQARSRRKVHRRADIPTLVAAAREMAAIESCEVTQVIFPLCTMDARSFRDMASQFHERFCEDYPRRPPILFAAFHPELSFSNNSGSQLVPFFRRSPDPLVQLVRAEVLDAVHRGRQRGSQFWDGNPKTLAAMLEPQPEDVSDRITRENFTRAKNGMLAEIKATYADILADRARSYGPHLQALGLAKSGDPDKSSIG